MFCFRLFILLRCRPSTVACRKIFAPFVILIFLELHNSKQFFYSWRKLPISIQKQLRSRHSPNQIHIKEKMLFAEFVRSKYLNFDLRAYQ